MQISTLGWHCLTLLEPEKVTCRGTTNRKDVVGLKLAMGQEAVGGSEPGPSGQRRPSQQAAAHPVIIEVEESAEEMGRGEEQGKVLAVLPKHNLMEPHRSDPKQKAVEVIPVMTKWVRIAQGPIDFEEELRHVS